MVRYLLVILVLTSVAIAQPRHEGDIGKIRSDIDKIKSDIEKIKSDITELKTKVALILWISGILGTLLITSMVTQFVKRRSDPDTVQLFKRIEEMEAKYAASLEQLQAITSGLR